jgi:hypothetical protein
MQIHEIKHHLSTWGFIAGGGLVSADMWHGAFTFIGAAGTFLLGVAACGQVAYHFSDLNFRREQAFKEQLRDRANGLESGRGGTAPGVDRPRV